MFATYHEDAYQAGQDHMFGRGRTDKGSGTSVGVIAVPGGGGTETSWQSGTSTNPDLASQALQKTADGGYGHGRTGHRFVAIASNWTWGNDTMLDRIDDAFAYAIANHGFAADTVHLYGVSIGATAVLNWAAQNPSSVASIALILPAVDIQDIDDNDRLDPYALPAPSTAYGDARPPDTHNPADNADDLNGLSIKAWYSNNDTVCLPGPIESWGGPAGAELVNIGDQTLIGIPGHGLVTGFDPDEIGEFFSGEGIAVPQTVSVSLSAVTGISTSFILPIEERAVSIAASTGVQVIGIATDPPLPQPDAGLAASELYLWGGGGSAPTGVALDNTEMNWLDARGFKHIHMGIGRLRGFGGSPAQDFRADGGPVTAANYDYQEQIQNSDFVDRWHAYGADHKCYLQWDAAHTNDPPGAAIAPWFTDGTSTTGWTGYCNRLRELAAYANWQGFDGLASDWEVFNDNNDAWHWDRWSTTDTHTEAQVRQQAFDRGAQMMTAILAGMPNADVYIYNMFEPDGWHALRSHYFNNQNIKGEDWVQWDLFKGMASVGGYSALKTNTAEFQKQVNPQEAADQWGNAFRYSINNMGAMLSQDLSSDDWEYAYTRVKWMPFAWLDEIVNSLPSAFSYKKPFAYVNEQLQSMREWGMGEMLPIFDHSGFNLTHYVDHNGVSYNAAMEDAAVAGTADSTPPTLPVPTTGATTITGTATDNYAMWAVKWEDNAGGSGMAECTYQITSNASSQPALPGAEIVADRFNWTIQRADITPAATQVTITAVDSHMLESTPRTVTGI